MLATFPSEVRILKSEIMLVLMHAENFGITAFVHEKITKMSLTEIKDLFESAVTTPLKNRTEVLHLLLKETEVYHEELKSTQLLQMLIEHFPNDLRAQRELVYGGVSEQQNLVNLILSLSQLDEPAKNKLYLTQILTQIAARDPQQFTVTEALSLLSEKIASDTGMLELLKTSVVLKASGTTEEATVSKQFVDLIPWDGVNEYKDAELTPSELNSKKYAIAQSKEERTPFFAVIEKLPSIASWLLDEKPKIIRSISLNKVDAQSRTLLQAAITSQNAVLARRVLGLYSKYTNDNIKQWLNRADNSPAKNTPLFDAVVSTHYDKLVRPLLDLGADPKSHDKRGRSILSLLYQIGLKKQSIPIERIADIILSGVKADLPDRWGRTIGMFAAQKKDIPTLLELEKLGAKFRQTKDSRKKTAYDYATLTEDQQYLMQFEIKFGAKRGSLNRSRR